MTFASRVAARSVANVKSAHWVALDVAPISGIVAPMTALIETVLLFLAVLVVVAVIARRLNTAPSILLVVAGIVLALIPDLPTLELAPELVLLVSCRRCSIRPAST